MQKACGNPVCLRSRSHLKVKCWNIQFTLRFRVQSISFTPLEGSSLNLSQTFSSRSRFAERTWPPCPLKVKVTLASQRVRTFNSHYMFVSAPYLLYPLKDFNETNASNFYYSETMNCWNSAITIFLLCRYYQLVPIFTILIVTRKWRLCRFYDCRYVRYIDIMFIQSQYLLSHFLWSPTSKWYIAERFEQSQRLY